MRKLIAGLLTVLIVFSGWSAAPETAVQGKRGVKGMMGAYNDGGNLRAKNVRLNSSGHVIVDAGTNTITVAGPQLEAIKIAAQAIEGIGNTTLAELQAQSLQLGVIEGNGTTGTASLAAIEAEQLAQSLQLGVIEGNGTTGTASLAAIEAEQALQSLQLGVIEGNGTTGTASLAVIESEIQAQTLQLGVIEGNGTTGTASLGAIETVIVGTGAASQEVQGTAADGAAAVGNPHVIAGIDSSGNVDAFATDNNGRMPTVARAGSGDNISDILTGYLRDVSNFSAIPFNIGLLWDGSGWDRPYGDSTNGAWVNVKTSVLATGAATEATLASQLISQQATEGAGNTTAANTGTIAGAVAGGQMQVDVVAEIPAGTQQIGKVAISDGGAQTADINDGASYDSLFVRLTDGTNVSSLSGTGDLEVSGDGGVALATEASLEDVETEVTAINAKIANDGGVEAGAVLVTMASDSTGLLSVDDNGGSLTVDGTVTIADASTNTIGARFVYNPGQVNANGNYSGQQTDTAVWTPAAGKKIVLMGVWYSSAAALTLELEDDDVDVIPPAYVSATGGGPITAGPCPLWIGDADDTLDFSSSGAGNCSVLLWGYEE